MAHTGPNYSQAGRARVLDYSNWVFGLVNRSVVITASDATTDVATYKEADGTTAFVVTTVYSNAAHDAIVSITRTT